MTGTNFGISTMSTSADRHYTFAGCYTNYNPSLVCSLERDSGNTTGSPKIQAGGPDEKELGFRYGHALVLCQPETSL